MPGLDRMGPEGEGPKTGRQSGRCNPSAIVRNTDNYNSNAGNGIRKRYWRRPGLEDGFLGAGEDRPGKNTDNMPNTERGSARRIRDRRTGCGRGGNGRDRSGQDRSGQGLGQRPGQRLGSGRQVPRK